MEFSEGKTTGGAGTLLNGPRESQTPAGETMGLGSLWGWGMSLRERPQAAGTGEFWTALGGGVCRASGVYACKGGVSTSNQRVAADLVGSCL